MAAASRVVSIANTATALSVAGSAAILYNDGTQTIYIGGPAVAASGATKGIPIQPGDTMPLQQLIGSGALGGAKPDLLYGIVAATTCSMVILEVGL